MENKAKFPGQYKSPCYFSSRTTLADIYINFIRAHRPYSRGGVCDVRDFIKTWYTFDHKQSTRIARIVFHWLVSGYVPTGIRFE